MNVRLHSAGPGRTGDAARLVEMHDEIAGGRRTGATVFIGGDDSDGRAALLMAVASELRRSRSLVVAGSFVGHHFEAWEGEEDPSRKATLALLESIIPIAQSIHPALALLARFLSPGRAAWRLVSQIRDRGKQIDPALLLPQLMRVSAQERAVACVVDFAEDAQVGWWEDLLMLFANEIADALPILLVVGLEGPPELGSEEEGGPSGLYTARVLSRRHLAEWWPLRRIDRHSLSAWIGPSDPSVLDELMVASNGRSAMATQLWDAWQGAAVVERHGHDPRWTFTTHSHANLVVERLKRLVAADDGLPGVERARVLLSVAALEGRSFTAEAVAQALNLERDATIDYLDDTLAVSAAHPDGFVAEVGAIATAQGYRNVWMYRFVSELHRMTLRASLTSEEELKYSGRLAEALVACYGGASPFVAVTVARLFDAGGKPGLAGAFWRLSRIGQDTDVILWRALRLLAPPEPVGVIERRRASEVLLAAAVALYDTSRLTDGLALAQAALRHSVEGSEDRGLAYYHSAWFRAHLGQYGEARKELVAALDIWQRLHQSSLIADATHQLANLDVLEEDYTVARQRYRAVLEVRVRLQDLAGVATVREMLAELDDRAGDVESARAELANVLSIERQIGDLAREGLTLARLAGLEFREGDHVRAHELYVEALKVSRLAGSSRTETIAGMNFAALNAEMGDYDAARAALLAVLRVSQGDPPSQAYARQELGHVATAAGDLREARAQHLQALTLYRGLGDADGEAASQSAIDALAAL